MFFLDECKQEGKNIHNWHQCSFTLCSFWVKNISWEIVFILYYKYTWFTSKQIKLELNQKLVNQNQINMWNLFDIFLTFWTQCPLIYSMLHFVYKLFLSFPIFFSQFCLCCFLLASSCWLCSKLQWSAYLDNIFR